MGLRCCSHLSTVLAAAAEKCWSHLLVDPAPGRCGTSVSQSSSRDSSRLQSGSDCNSTGAKFKLKQRRSASQEFNLDLGFRLGLSLPHSHSYKRLEAQDKAETGGHAL